MSPKKILVVDDTREIGRMIQAALDTLGPGLETTVLPTAEEALQEIEHQAFDLMVIDVRLPGISGLELTRKLRNRKHTAKVIQISGINDPRLREMSTQLGADMFFAKPLIMNEFLATVEKLLGATKTSPRLGSSGKSRPRTQLDQALAGLRQRLSAAAVAVFDYNGNTSNSVGDIPRLAGSDMLQLVCASLNAAERAGRQFSQPGPENLLLIRGADYDLAAVPLGNGYAAGVFLQRGPTGVRLAIAVDELLAGQKGLAVLLAGKAPAVSRPVEVPLPPEPPPIPAVLPEKQSEKPAPTEAELDAELASLFTKYDLKALKSADLDAFWISAADDKGAQVGGSQEAISFDQAKKMGLAPKDGA